MYNFTAHIFQGWIEGISLIFQYKFQTEGGKTGGGCWIICIVFKNQQVNWITEYKMYKHENIMHL